MKHPSMKELGLPFPTEPDMIGWMMGNGNIGAYSFCMQALTIDYDAAVKGLQRLDEMHVNDKWLYCFWNDCFDRNTKLAIEAMNECPEEIIIEALDGISEERYNFKPIRKEAGQWKL